MKHFSSDTTCVKLSEYHLIEKQLRNIFVLDPIQWSRSSTENWQRTSTVVSIEPEGEEFNHIEVIDISTITSSDSSIVFESSIDGATEKESLETGRLGEEMVYKYLSKQHPHPATVKWLNQSRESQLPYDILLTKNGIIQYIEVKSTRTPNQHIFPLSINQIECLIQKRENYFIYRVYTDEGKIIVLDNVRWRLIAKEQLACFLQIIPKSSH